MKKLIFHAGSLTLLTATISAQISLLADVSACEVTAIAALPAAISTCSSIVLRDLALPGGISLNLSGIRPGTSVTFAGRTTFGYANQNYPLIFLNNATNITISGAPGSIIDGNGDAWWDGLGSNGGKIKPIYTFSLANVKQSVLGNLYIQNYPCHGFYLNNCSGIVIDGLTMNNTAGDQPNSASGNLPAGHNTDGIDLTQTNDTVIRNLRVYNQDDCVAVGSGRNITVTNAYCSGSHGLSIGSVGNRTFNNVSDITFQDSVITNSQIGPRVKTKTGAVGFVRNITYRNIRLVNIKQYGIDINQDYSDGRQADTNLKGVATNGVIIDGVHFSNITGTTASSGANYYILCGDGSCRNITFDNVNVTGGSKPSSCNAGAPFNCTTG